MRILVLGAGRMGYGAVFDLIHNSPDVELVTVADADDEKLRKLANSIGPSKLLTEHLDVSKYEATVSIMNRHDSAISCVNYWYNLELSKIAVETMTNLCDLGGNNSVVEKQLSLDEKAAFVGINIIPDCGLAPGMVSVLAMHGARRFDSVHEIHIRVGELPQNPKTALNYQLVFSVEGLINQYIEKARVVRNGEIVEIESMTEVEELSFDGFPPLEAFQTSGGTSTLPDSFKGKISELDYKTIRYAGHCEKFKTMIDIGLCSSEPVDVDGHKVSPRRIFGKLLEGYLPADEPDYVLVRLDFEGIAQGLPTRLRYDIVDKQDEKTGLSAMMRTTSFPASIVAQMMARGEVSKRGATPQETVIDPEKFVSELARRDIEINETGPEELISINEQ
ncbi:MAG: saccharopine dehydrogenase NADP-binding domain-containing protein [Acidobacteriota bacterium]|nr:saccharopine dehydrogenase NADP-binding domain-containing protein [Acidobacteriota bacterium]